MPIKYFVCLTCLLQSMTKILLKEAVHLHQMVRKSFEKSVKEQFFQDLLNYFNSVVSQHIFLEILIGGQ